MTEFINNYTNDCFVIENMRQIRIIKGLRKSLYHAVAEI
jgi:hypothetical protein